MDGTQGQRERKKSATTQESPPWLLELDRRYPQIDCSRLWPNADRRFVLWPRESADSCCWVSEFGILLQSYSWHDACSSDAGRTKQSL